MTKTSEQMTKQDPVEALLEQAAPRPAPPAEDQERVREAVHAEWQLVTGRYRSRRRTMQFALAASIVVAIAVVFSVLRVDEVAPVRIASIDRSHGPVYMLGDESQLLALNGSEVVHAGQVIVTRSGAGIGLRWGNGGSLRIDEKSEVEFTSGESVFLHTGRIYFDSEPTDFITSISGGSGSSRLRIDTDHGSVSHLGTQFMTETDIATLRVSVREGEVTVDGRFYDEVAHEGQRLELTGSGRPSVTNISRSGEEWQWVEATSPSLVVDGMSTYEFLHWVGRETGHEISFTSPEAERTARSGTLRGKVTGDPRTELRIRMMGEDLSYEFDGGTINVRNRD